MTKYPAFSRRSLLGAGMVLPFIPFKSVSAAGPEGLSIQRLAWAGVRLESGDATLFVDAVASNPGENMPAAPALESALRRRYALVTHHHGDHCDPTGLQPVLGERGYIVAQEDVARLFDPGSVTVQSVRHHEPVLLSRTDGEFVAFCVPAEDGLGSPQVSWIIDGGGRRIIHCGDTAWHGGWWDIARAYGPFDIAFLPINGVYYRTGRFSGAREPMSLTPEQAANAAAILQPRLAIPLHYGLSGDPEYIEQESALPRFQAAAEALGLTVRNMIPGEIITL